MREDIKDRKRRYWIRVLDLHFVFGVQVLQALTRKFKLSEYVNLEKVANECAITFTGADLYALCADAWMNALKRTAAEVCNRDPLWPAQLKLAVNDFVVAIALSV